ncbi:MAG TPA: 2-oxo acid dehydrogenase subunit E2 [Myxococcales bacterium]|nr:2-oxo acid dehydrogenase subunit E2 [Myxococcales bacterium]
MTVMSPFRRLATGTWGDPRDPAIYASFRVRMDDALAYLEEVRRMTGKDVTVTHLVIRATAEALRSCPEANSCVRWRRVERRQSTDVSALVLCGERGRRDLASLTVAAADQKSIERIADEVAEGVARIRDGTAPLERARRSLARVPRLLMRLALALSSFLTSTLRLPIAGRSPFGAAVITSAGSLGIERLWGPLVWWSKAAFVLAPGKIVDEPVVEDGRVVPGKVMWIGATFDHRIVDGIHIAEIGEALRRVLEAPFSATRVPARAAVEVAV